VGVTTAGICWYTATTPTQQLAVLTHPRPPVRCCLLAQLLPQRCDDSLLLRLAPLARAQHFLSVGRGASCQLSGALPRLRPWGSPQPAAARGTAAAADPRRRSSPRPAPAPAAAASPVTPPHPAWPARRAPRSVRNGRGGVFLSVERAGRLLRQLSGASAALTVGTPAYVSSSCHQRPRTAQLTLN
jgi:hypothetical protein